LSREAHYTLLDHAADLAVRLRAPSLEALFVEGARALFDLLGTLGSTEPLTTERIELEGRDLEELFHDWLSELLFRFSARGETYCQFRVLALDPRRLRAEVAGETLQRKRHTVEREIKAVTYHGLEIVEDEEGWRATLIFDV